MKLARAFPVCVSVVASLASACAGKTTPLPAYGEALVVVDTDLPVPALAGRLRVDVYSEEGQWLEARSIGRSDPRDWPASFSVFSDDDTKTRLALVRLRVYPDGSERRYAGERGSARAKFTSPHVASSIQDLCAGAPDLPIGGDVTMRQGDVPITTHTIAKDCPQPSTAGAVAARVTIATAGSYRFSVASSVPWINATTLSLRSSCDDASSQIACNLITNPAGYFTTGHFARFDATLTPGTYWLFSTGMFPGFVADTTLEAMPLDTDPPPRPPEASAPPVAPRLVVDGHDRTPETEPVPSAAVDRLVLVELVPNVRGMVRVTLRGACAGTAAELGDAPGTVTPKTARTCTETEGALAPVLPARFESIVSPPGASVAGTFGPKDPCPSVATTAGALRVCIPSGVFLFGSRIVSPTTLDIAQSAPERIAVMPRFWIDRDEVTVGRFRDAVARGLTIGPNDVAANDDAFPPPKLDSSEPLSRYCSWSTKPIQPSDREDYALSCISWQAARAFCRFEGGDLPTEAEWEYAALAAGRPYKTIYPWGDDAPGCTRGVFSRYFPELSAGTCPAPFGPAPISQSDGSDGRLPDATPQGVVGLAGNLMEWTLDSLASFGDTCWQSAGLVSPRCFEEQAPYRSIRGATWFGDGVPLVARNGGPGAITAEAIEKLSFPDPSMGFRCAYQELKP